MSVKALAEATAEVANGNNSLALYIIRDCPATVEAGLSDLVWSYFACGSCDYVPTGEIEYILQRIEEVLL